ARVCRDRAWEGHGASRSSPCGCVAGRWPARPATIADRTTRTPASRGDNQSGTVNDYMQYALVIPFIEAMRSRAPKIRLAILPPITSGLTEKLCGDVDLAIQSPIFSHPDLPSRLRYRDRYVCIVRKEHALKRSRPS